MNNAETIPLKRMRTINQCVKMFKEADPQTCITTSLVRRLVKDGKIEYKMSGTKCLINLDDFYEFLNN